MTGRTHDLTAFTALHIAFAVSPLPMMRLSTALVAFSLGMVGGVIPDLDEWTSDSWDKIPAGSLIGRFVQPLLLGSHRLITHSLLGMAICGGVLWYGLTAVAHVILVDMTVVWWATMIGYFSHLVADSLTKEGVPWLFPIPLRYGIPPMRFLRIRTGSWREFYMFVPALLLLNGYLLYTRYEQYVLFFRSFGK
jgi:inner membrane protein